MESTTPNPPPAVRMESITKRFPGIVANQNVSITVQPATFHAVIGENGAGKSTLLNVLYGRYKPDEGSILVNGNDLTNRLNSPADAIRHGLGLVSQHYALISALSVLENIILGAEPAGAAGVLNRRSAREAILAITEKLGLPQLNLDVRADQLSVAMGQKIEIVKALFRGVKILLLDEPTATLAPQEAESLFALLSTLLQNGTTILFVTHKLREVIAYSQNVTVLRAGRNAGNFVTSETSPEELLAAMIGPRGHAPAAPHLQGVTAILEETGSLGLPTNQKLLANSGEERLLGRPPTQRVPANSGGEGLAGRNVDTRYSTPESVRAASYVLKISNLSVPGRLGPLAVRNANVEVRAGEILGVAGVDGSGQRELAETVVGLLTPNSGNLELSGPGGGPGIALNTMSVRDRQAAGIAYIPEDRHRRALALDFTVAENFLMGHENAASWGGGVVLDYHRMSERADAMVKLYDVRMGERDSRTPAKTLSGGNQQKIVVARAIESGPRLLVASQPTRGLDVEAARFVYRALREARDQGLGILLFSLDLDEIMELSDRIAVMFNGEIAGIVPRVDATAESIGALMTGASKTASEQTVAGAAP